MSRASLAAQQVSVDLAHHLANERTLEIVGDELNELPAGQLVGDAHEADRKTVSTRARLLHTGVSPRWRERYGLSEQKYSSSAVRSRDRPRWRRTRWFSGLSPIRSQTSSAESPSTSRNA